MTNICINYVKWTCMALMAGVLVTGLPGQGQALDLTANSGGLGILDAILIGDNKCDGIPVCSDQKGQTCEKGSPDAKCCSVGGTPLCQTCTKQDDGTYKWGKAGKGKSCWDDNENNASSGVGDEDEAVLHHF